MDDLARLAQLETEVRALRQQLATLTAELQSVRALAQSKLPGAAATDRGLLAHHQRTRLTVCDEGEERSLVFITVPNG
jgi:hypothetical protein